MCLCSSRYFTLEAEQRFTLVDSVICGVTCIRHASPYPLYSTRTPASSVHQVIALTPNAGEDNQTGMYVPMESRVLWFKEIYKIILDTEGCISGLARTFIINFIIFLLLGHERSERIRLVLYTEGMNI